jgi:hypothetical protein
MPRNITVTFDDGSTHVYQNAPDDITPEAVSARAQQEFGRSVTALDGGRGQQQEPPAQAPMEQPQPGKKYSLENNALGAISEPVTTMVTGLAGTAFGGLAGLAQGAKNLVSPGMPAADRVAQVQEAMTYQPRTAAGKATTAAAGKVLGYPFRKLAEGADAAGGATTDATGSPAAGAAVNTAIQSVPAVLLRGKVNRGSRSPNSAGAPVAEPPPAPKVSAATEAGRKPGLARTGEAPAIDELKSAKDAAYKKAEDTGVVISDGALKRLKVQLVDDLNKGGLDKTLHPDTTAALARILEKKGQLSLREMETLRQIAGDAAGSIKKGDARLGRKIIDRIDDFEASLTEKDVVAGNPAAGSAFKEARALNARYSKAVVIDDIFKSAKRATGANYTVAGMETALRQKFRALAENKKKMRGFSAEERAAIEQFISGGKTENLLRRIGKFAPDGVISGYGAVAAAAYNPLLAAIPAAGGVAKYASTRMGIKNANNISELVRRGPQTPIPYKRNALAETP